MNIAHPKLERVRQWSRQEDTIRALVITGSHARDDGTTDEFSDLDIQVISADLNRFTADDSWLDMLGEVWIRFPLNQNVPFRLVWFRGGIKVDFQFIDLEDMPSIALSEEYARGYHILLDKDNLFHDLPPSTRGLPQQPPPNTADVQNTINEFRFEALHVAQFIRRRDFWVVKHRDWTMKCDLLRMLAWQARILNAEPLNTSRLGRRLSCWADDTLKAAVEGIWAGWEAEALWDALFLQLMLFQRLAEAVTDALHCEYPAETYSEIEAYIRSLWRDARSASATD